jgi:hypothetical protein
MHRTVSVYVFFGSPTPVARDIARAERELAGTTSRHVPGLSTLRALPAGRGGVLATESGTRAGVVTMAEAATYRW